MDILVKVGQLILSLSILIVLHELGHFLPAKWFKTQVDKFYLFFDAPPFNSLWKKKIGDTEYGIGWLPLGGYVKIAGMVDESMDTEFKNQAPQPWEFRSKPAWQRLIIMLGGVTVNFVLGFLIFGLLLWFCGKDYLPNSETKQYGVAFDSVLIQQGFQNGDVIMKLGDTNFVRFDPVTVLEKVILGNERRITVLRNDSIHTFNVGNDIARKVTDRGVPKSALLAPRMPFVADRLAGGSPAEKAGILAGDQIIRFNGNTTAFYDQFVIEAQKNKGKAADIGVIRNGDTININLTLTAEGTIGVFPRAPNKFFKFERQDYTFAQAMPAGYRDGVDFLKTQVSAFGKMFTGQISANKNLGSFISIGNMFPSTWDWEVFWHMTATLSLILAFMNLLPIPALDGGYVVFLIWEVITGRKVSDNVLEKAVTVGFFLLMALMIYAFGLDLWRHVFSKFF